MHELSITESILEITLRHARQAQAKKITDLFLVVGQLSSIVDDSVQFYWDFVSQGTEAEGARLHFRRIPAELVCQSCQRRFDWNGEDVLCPDCHSAQVKVASGEEFYLESIVAE